MVLKLLSRIRSSAPVASAPLVSSSGAFSDLAIGESQEFPARIQLHTLDEVRLDSIVDTINVLRTKEGYVLSCGAEPFFTTPQFDYTLDAFDAVGEYQGQPVHLTLERVSHEVVKVSSLARTLNALAVGETYGGTLDALIYNPSKKSLDLRTTRKGSTVSRTMLGYSFQTGSDASVIRPLHPHQPFTAGHVHAVLQGEDGSHVRVHSPDAIGRYATKPFRRDQESR